MTYRSLFDETIGHDPAPRHSVEELIVRYRRRVLMRRVAGAGAAAATLAVEAAMTAALSAPPPPGPAPGART
ncbi:hypothetical protein, partial [Dactylosporangium salmoneum]|uniref:hypothetical protein n=1 Tax=Dactylosporangium salmoneum TaxID=53361 RepID=UPI0031E03772